MKHCDLEKVDNYHILDVKASIRYQVSILKSSSNHLSASLMKWKVIIIWVLISFGAI